MKMIASLFYTEPETKFTLEAIYIAINRPHPLCKQLSTPILNILGELLETGVTSFFFSPLLNPIN